MTLLDFENIMMLQNNKCPICRCDFNELKDKDICVDHNHETGKVRGILCRLCNVRIGCLKDDINILQLAIYYLNNN